MNTTLKTDFNESFFTKKETTRKRPHDVEDIVTSDSHKLKQHLDYFLCLAHRHENNFGVLFIGGLSRLLREDPPKKPPEPGEPRLLDVEDYFSKVRV